MGGSGYEALADRVEDAVRAYVLASMPMNTRGELATESFRGLLHIYGNWRGRHPFPRPRTVHRSREMQASAEAQTWSSEIAALVRKMEEGEDLKPHLSLSVDTAFLSTEARAALPPHKREQDLDRMLAAWGVHHLHLSAALESDVFKRQGDHLLFVLLGRDDAYLLGIYTHRDFVREELVHIIVRNWPGVGPFHKLNFVQGTTYQPTEQERKVYRKAGMSGGPIEVDGSWYGALGQTSAGMPIADTRPVMALCEELRLLRENPAERLAQLAALLDEHAGHPVTGDWAPYVEDDIVGLTRGGEARIQLAVLPGGS